MDGAEYEVVQESAESAPPEDNVYGFEKEPAVILPVVECSESTVEETERPKQKKKKRKNQGSFLDNLPAGPLATMLGGAAVVLLIVVIGFMIEATQEPLFLIGALLALVGGLWGLVTAFLESPLYGVLYFVDCTSIYRLYYVITRWEAMRRPFLLSLAGLALSMPFQITSFVGGFKRGWREVQMERMQQTGPVMRDNLGGPPIGI